MANNKLTVFIKPYRECGTQKKEASFENRQKMKKLKNLKLDALKEVLTREQMKKITGGYNCQGVPCGITTPCCPTYHCMVQWPLSTGFCTHN
jgi:natural product precursor